MKCIYQKLDGNQCNANAMSNAQFCFTHNPETQELKKQAVLKGGLATKNREPSKALKRLDVKSIPDSLVVLEDTINRVRTEPMTPQRANCIGFLLTLAFKAMETHKQQQLEERIKEDMRRGPVRA